MAFTGGSSSDLDVNDLDDDVDEVVDVAPSRSRLPGLGQRLRFLRWSAMGLLVVGFVWSAQRSGVPFDRERLAMWILPTLAIGCIGRSWGDARRLLIDWTPFLGFFLAYDFSRGAANDLGLPVHVTAQIDVEKALFFGNVPTVWFQQQLYDRGTVHWWEVIVAFTYVTHFFVPLVVAAILWAKRRPLYRMFITRLLTVSFLGVAVFCIAPTAPPWMAAEQGHIEPVSRIAQNGWSKVGLHFARSLIDKGQGTINTVAAIPSLHAAYAMILAAFLWPMIERRWLRPLLLIHPTMMVFTIVYGGEHYVVDALAGLVCVWAAFRFWAWFEARRGWDTGGRPTTYRPVPKVPGLSWGR
ncbi:MAG: phosphatase PAP2 family protein [Acidimicrobiia bacterium]